MVRSAMHALTAMLAVIICCHGSERRSAGDETAAFNLRSPRPFEVVQRMDFDPRESHENAADGAGMGHADVTVCGPLPASPNAQLQYRTRLLAGGEGHEVDWSPVAFQVQAGEFVAHVHVAAGGWYRLELRFLAAERVAAQGQVEPVGVGEVFLVAGQSYATNCNDQRENITDPTERVAAYDMSSHTWRVAHDPQPVADGSDGGSVWPAFGDQLVPLLRVPVGLVNVGVGATASGQWLPGGVLHERLVKAGQTLQPFRAVLWQQGESDVIAQTSTEDYVRNLVAIRDAAVKAWGFEPPWLLAKSTLHPTVYHDAEQESRIRTAIEQLWLRPGFLPGPDTDILGGENRGGPTTRRHFSAIGQRRAATLWFASVWQMLNHPPSNGEHE